MSTPALLTPESPTRSKGHIELILGPMFSGKTTELIRRINRFRLARLQCLVLKYSGDARYSKDDVATHDAHMLPAVTCSLLKGHCSKAQDFDVIGIDEGQFFPDLIEFCEALADQGRIVVVAALDGTYQRTGFCHVLDLVPRAESVIKLHAVCMNCFGSASFTKRRTEETTVELIGGAEKYMSVCRECYHGRGRAPCVRGARSPLKDVILNGPQNNIRS